MQLRRITSAAAAAVVAVVVAGGPVAQAQPAGDRGIAPIPGPGFAGYEASRWVPEHASSAVVARSLRDAQRTVHLFAASLGVPLGLDATALSRVSTDLFGLDLTSPEDLARLGIDVDASAAVFTEDTSIVAVVRVAKPDLVAAFVQRAKVTKHQRVAGIDVATHLPDSGPGVTDKTQIATSYATDSGWLWIRIALGQVDSVAWFRDSRAGTGGALPDWSRATHGGTPPLIGFYNPRAMLSSAAGAAGLGECARRFEHLGHIEASATADDRRVSIHAAVDLGRDAAALSTALAPPPAGWAALTVRAPLVAQWNADLAASATWLDACVKGSALDDLRDRGIRSARAVLLTYVDSTHFTGALALDLSDPKAIQDKLDDIPLRKHLEQDRVYGAAGAAAGGPASILHGKHLSVPGLFGIDYVLQPRLALLGAGDGVLDRLVTAPAAAPAVPTPLIAADLTPAALTTEQWRDLAAKAGLPDATATALAMLGAVHVGASLDHGALVIDASAERR